MKAKVPHSIVSTSFGAVLSFALTVGACSASSEFDETPMVFVPAGEFLSGGGANVRSDEIIPVRTVELAAFSIDKFETTVASYRKCVNAGACNQGMLRSLDEGVKAPQVAASDNTLPTALATVPPTHCTWSLTGHNDFPINCVTWREANEYCRWVGKRLPSAREWEKAAGGTDARAYPWGNTAPTCTYAVMDDGGLGCKTGNPLPVGSRPKGVSPYGAFDMQGNVAEWVADSDLSLFATFRLIMPELGLWKAAKYLIEIGPDRLHFGSNFTEDASSLRRIRDRVTDPADARQYGVGFRCAL